jgi:RHS repeat-associated protein
LEEKTGATLTRVYCYGLDLISQREVSTGATYYFGYDGNGNVRFLTATNASVANVFAYDAFGTLIASNAAPQTDYLFAGEQRDANLGFYYLRARYLNAGTGRFWTRDADEGWKFEPRSLHKYTYTGNDPVNQSDPSGQDTYTLPGINIGTAIQGVFAALILSAITIAYIKATTTVGTISRTRNEDRAIYFHYSQSPPTSFVLGLSPPAWVTPVGGMDATTAMFSLGIPRPNYEYTFRISPYKLGPANNSTPGRLTQYEVLEPTGPDSLVSWRSF